MHLNVMTRTFDDCDGYGRMGVRLIAELLRHGVQITPFQQQWTTVPAWLGRLAGFDFSRLTLSMMSGDWVEPVAGRQWVFSMWEDTKLPDEWVVRFNAFSERIIVPCEHNAQVFRESGVTKPIHVVPLGISPYEFPLITRPAHETYTFLTWGDRGWRKGYETACLAFHKAFPLDQYPDVRLLIKARTEGLQNIVMKDTRVSIWRADVPNMSDVFVHADCVAFPAKGEGWGLPPREAAATGLPVIATRWSGLEVGIDEWAYPIERFTFQRSVLSDAGGEWVIPSYEELGEKMKWCYEHREAAAEHGRKASAWLHANQTWTHSARALLELLERYA